MNQKKNDGTREFNDAQVMRLGRTLRRISRTTKDLMKTLGISEDEVRIPRKRRRPSASKDKAVQA